MQFPHICFFYANLILQYPDEWTIDMVPIQLRADVQALIDEMTKKPTPAE